MKHRIRALLLSTRTAGAPPVVDASSLQRFVAGAARGVAMSADPIAQDLTARPGRIYRGATGPAQVLQPAGFIGGVESDVGISTATSWPLPRRRVPGRVL